MFYISKKALLRQYIIAAILLGIVVFALVYNKMFSLVSIGGFLFMIISVLFGLNSRRFKEFKRRTLQIEDDGLLLTSGKKHLKILWDDIKKVSATGKKDNISMLTLATKYGTINLSFFENLDVINSELKKHIDKGKWRHARFFRLV